MTDKVDTVFGIHAVSQALDSGNVVALYVQRGGGNARLSVLKDRARARSIPVGEWDRRDLDRRCDGNHQGVVAELTPARQWSESDLLPIVAAAECPLVLVLDGVTDPHNLGACLRTADAVGVTAVVAPKDKAVGLNATVRKVACGAADTVPFIAVTNLARCLDQLKQQGLWVVGTAGEADGDVFGQDLAMPLAVVMGSEGKGLRRLTRERCDYLVKLPMLGAVESLNISVATGVVLYEVLRQRRGVKS